MKVYLKEDPTRIGEVLDVYVTANGQKRMNVRFAYSTVDADVREFEIV